MDFAHGYTLEENDKNLDPSRILAIRIAYAYFVEKKNMIFGFSMFFEHCLNNINMFTLDKVLELIRADLNVTDNLFIVLHIDEVQYIFQKEKEMGRDFFKKLMYDSIMFYLTHQIKYIDMKLVHSLVLE